MLKLVKFSKLKKNAGFTSSRKNSSKKLYVKTCSKFCSSNGENGIHISSDEKVWADDSQIKPWWKLW